MLHDIGKIAIPDEILHKPGPLDERDWAFVRKHTVVGERIVSASPALRPVGRIVRSSHERWDGTGYPDELAGEEIPLASRIVCACDAFSAMTTRRPYHDAMSVDAALRSSYAARDRSSIRRRGPARRARRPGDGSVPAEAPVAADRPRSRSGTPPAAARVARRPSRCSDRLTHERTADPLGASTDIGL